MRVLSGPYTHAATSEVSIPAHTAQILPVPTSGPGDKATGGGFVLEPPVQAQSAQKDLGDGWFVYAWNPGDTPKKAHATVTCTWIDY